MFMIKAISLFIAIFLLFICGQVSANTVSKNSNTLTFELCQISANEIGAIDMSELYLPPVSEVDSIAMVLIANAVLMPVGDSVVLNAFPDRWSSTIRCGENEDESLKWMQYLGYNMRFCSNSATMIDEKYFRPLFNITPCLIHISHINLDSEFRAIAIRVAEYQHFTLYSFLTESILFRGGFQDIQIQSLVTISNDRVIDNLVVAYMYSDAYGNVESQFFYYDGKRIHIKEIGEIDGGWIGVRSYWKFQLTPQGRFIRYHEQNGFLENNNERGLVKNHTREGKWIDRRGNLHIEAHYESGLPVGIWRYYEILQDPQPPFSLQRGDLIYTETFENGRLVKRELFNDSWREWAMDFFD